MNNKKLILRSVDFKYFLSGALWYGIPTVIFAILAITVPESSAKLNALRLASGFTLIILIPITLYCLVRIFILFSGAGDYKICTAVSVGASNSFASLWRACSFTLEISPDDGTSAIAESSGVFKYSAFSPTYVGNYQNKRLQVLYNPKTAAVIVIGALEETDIQR